MSGSMAVFHALQGRLEFAAYFIVLAGIIDFFDGFAARLFNQSSEIGKQLDSLADVISFGLAPGSIFFFLLGAHFEYSENALLTWQLLGFLLPAFAALRLAKFNVDKDQDFDFIGMPSPAMGFYTAGLAFWVGHSGMHEFFFSLPGLLVQILVLSFLMILPVKMMSLKFKSKKPAENLDKIIFAVGVMILLIIFRTLSLPLIILWYVIFSIAGSIIFTKKSPEI